MRSIVQFAGSVWLASVLLVLILFALATGTIYETWYGSEQAITQFYKAEWFQGLLWLVGLNIFFAMAVRFPFKRQQAGFVVAHVSILLVLIGAYITERYGINGQVTISEGQTVEQFVLPQDVVTLTDLANQESGMVDVRTLGREIRVGKVLAKVVRYAPDSQRIPTVKNDHPTTQPAVEVSFSDNGKKKSSAWVFAHPDPEMESDVIKYQVITDNKALDRLLRQSSTSQPTGSITVEYQGKKSEISLEASLKKPVTVGTGGLTVHTLRYMPHAVVGKDRQVKNATSQPVNPAVEVEIRGSGKTEKRLLFGRFPDFSSMHEKKTFFPDVKVVFNQPEIEEQVVPIRLIETPRGNLLVRFQYEDKDSGFVPLKPGKPVNTPWEGQKFTVLRRYEHARMDWEVHPSTAVRKNPVPAVLVQIQLPQEKRELWVQKNSSQTVSVEGKNYDFVYTNKVMPLGFGLTLDWFRVGYYPGGDHPRSYESQVTIDERDGKEPRTRLISMNHPATVRGYTFYQSSFSRTGDRNTSVLSVTRDPGKPIVFTGYIGIMIGMIVVLIRRIKRNSLMLILLFLLPASTAFGGRSDLDLSAIRAIPVQHDGRWMPLDTLARDMVKTITGDEEFENNDPMETFLSWTFDPQGSEKKAIIRIPDPSVRTMVGLAQDRTYFSYHELINNESLTQVLEKLTETMGQGKPDAPVAKVFDIDKKISLLSDIFVGRVINVIPNSKEQYGPWRPIHISPNNPEENRKDPVKKAWIHLGRTFLEGKPEAFNKASEEFLATLNALPAAYRPNPGTIEAELDYNHGKYFRLAWMVLGAGAVLSLAGMWICKKGFDLIVSVVLAAGFVILTYGLILRWQIAGHIPAANMFESLLFLSWGMIGFALVWPLVFSHRIVSLTASVLGAAALILADRLPLDQFIRPIAPVLLDTVWMSIHVPVIMVSYSVLALAVLIAHVQLFTYALFPGRQDFLRTLERLQYGYVYVGSMLLTAGILTGSMWAASSWGRYWGWDPKEVWSLAALLGYLAILHVQTDHKKVPWWGYIIAAGVGAMVFAMFIPMLGPITVFKLLMLAGIAAVMVFFVLTRGAFAMVLKSIVAFWLILMTYVGVNYILGTGLHSYAFGTGAVAVTLFKIGTIDLLLIGLCSLVYWMNRKEKAPV